MRPWAEEEWENLLNIYWSIRKERWEVKEMMGVFALCI